MSRSPLLTDTGRSKVVSDEVTGVLATPPVVGELRFATIQGNLWVGTTTGWANAAGSGHIVGSGTSGRVPVFFGAAPPINTLLDSKLEQTTDIGVKTVDWPLGPVALASDPVVAAPVDPKWLGQMYFNTTSSRLRVFVGPTVTDWSDVGDATSIGGSGTSGFIPRFATSTTLEDSRIAEAATFTKLSFGRTSIAGEANFAIHSFQAGASEPTFDRSLESFEIVDTGAGLNSLLMIGGASGSVIKFRDSTGFTNVADIGSDNDRVYINCNGKTAFDTQSDPDALPLLLGLNAGVQLHSVTTVERDALTPGEGQLVYNATTFEFQGRANGAWVSFGAGGLTGSGTDGFYPRFATGTSLENGRIAETTGDTKLSFGRTSTTGDANFATFSFNAGAGEPTFSRATDDFEVLNTAGLASMVMVGNDLSGCEISFRDTAGTLNNAKIASDNHRVYIYSNGKLSFRSPADPDVDPVDLGLNGGVKLHSITTVERDALTPSEGQIVFNSTTFEFQGRANGSWVAFGGAAGITGSGTDGFYPRFATGTSVENGRISEASSDTKLSFGRTSTTGEANFATFSFQAGAGEPSFSRSAEDFEIVNTAAEASLALVGSDLSGCRIKFRDNFGTLNDAQIGSDNHRIYIINNGKQSFTTPADPDVNPIDLGLNGGVKLHSITTVERDALTPSEGQIVFNSTAFEFQGRANGTWVSFGGAAGITGSGTDGFYPRFATATSVENSRISEASGDTKLSFGRTSTTGEANFATFSFQADTGEPTFARASDDFEIINTAGLASMVMVGNDLSGCEISFRDTAGTLNNAKIASDNHRVYIYSNNKLSFRSPADPDVDPVDLGLNSGIKLHSTTTAERDALTPSDGQAIYNVTTAKFQGRENGAWVDFTPQYAFIGYTAELQTIAVTNTYQEVTGGATGPISGFTRGANSSLTYNGETGKAFVIRLFGHVSAASTSIVVYRFLKNAAWLNPGSSWRHNITNASAVCAETTTTLTNGDVIQLEVLNETGTINTIFDTVSYSIRSI